jgi:hypothetical protein
MLDGTLLARAIGVGWAWPSLRLVPVVASAKLLGDRTMMPPTATAPALTSLARPKGRAPMVALAFELSGRRRLGKERGRWLDFSTGRAPGEVATEPVSWPSATIIF